MFKKILHEPLVHFLVLGALVFAIYIFLNGTESEDTHHIVVSKAVQKQLAYRWQKKYLRAPTEEDMQKMLDKEIYTEVMAREAKQMGLDVNDFIIRRRLAQKMEFVSDDLSLLVAPTDAELKSYLKTHEKMFRKEDSFSFKQIYIDVNKHHNDLKETFEKIKTALQTDTDIRALGDSFLLPVNNEHMRYYDVQRKFGKAFAMHLKTVKEGSWQGPIKSGYGAHFVYLEKREKGEIPAFESIKETLKNAWMSEKKDQNNQMFYKNLKKSYSVEIEK